MNIPSPYQNEKENLNFKQAIRKVCYMFVTVKERIHEQNEDNKQVSVEELAAYISGIGAGLMLSHKDYEIEEMGQVGTQLLAEYNTTGELQEYDNDD